MDNLTREQRRKNMKNIRSVGTKPEVLFMREIKKRKIYFAKNVISIFGKPDLVFRRKKVAVFIDSDFWHYNPRKFVMPKSNRNYWKNKISNNVERDKKVTSTLNKSGWVVIRFWESQVYKRLDYCIEKLLSVLYQESKT